MKIDLHMHTKSVNKHEAKTRNINDAIKFQTILEEANIQIGAITNHNMFDKDQYTKLKGDQNNNFLLLPGIEYDVNLSKNKDEVIRRQINVIYDPKDIDNFNSKIFENPSSVNNPIHIEKIIEIFDSKNTIFYLDYKKGSTSWNENEYNEFFYKNNIKIKGVVIFDTQKITTHFILQANNYQALIGSDLQNWDDYVDKDSKDLIDSRMKFDSYEIFINVLKHKPDLKIVQEARQEQKIDIKFKDSQLVLKKVPITNGTNVIFGAKSTGKTELLQELYNSYDSSKLIYKSENYSKEYGKLLSSSYNDDFKKHIDALSCEIKIISNHTEKHFNNFNHFYKSFQNSSKYKIQEKILNNIKSNDDEKNKIIKISEGYKEVFANIRNFFSGKEHKLLSKHEKLYRETQIKLQKEYLNIEKEYFSFNIMNQIKEEISKIILLQQGKFSMPSSLGLFDLFVQRDKIWNSIEKINGFEKEYEIEIETFDIPEGNSWVQKQDLYLFNKDEAKFIKNINFKESKWRDTKELLENLSNLLKIKKYSDPTNYIPKIKQLINEKIDCYVLKNYLYNYKNPKSEPSNGEKAFISLFKHLNNEKINAFFLDEPETYLGNKMISISLINKLKDLSIQGKKIIITTHVSSLGINTLPTNYIYRDLEKYENDEVYRTYVGHFDGNNKLKCLRGEGKEKNMINHLLEYFEGNENQFSFRKEIYECDKV